MISAKPGEPGVRPAQAFAQFFVPVAASLQERRPQTLKHGDTFAVFDHNGDAVGGPGSPEGIYHRDTRHLSHFYLTVEDLRPLLLSSTVRDDNAVLICDLTNPEFVDGEGRRRLAQDLLHLRRTRFLWNARAFDRLALTSYDTTPRLLRFRLDFAADFADIFEVRGARRDHRGTSLPPEIGQDLLAYVGCIAGAVSIDEYREGLKAAGFAHVEIIDSRADLNAYARIEGQFGCCGGAMAGEPELVDFGFGEDCRAPEGNPSDIVPEASCCSPAESKTPEIITRLAELSRRHDLNAYAASVKVFAVKPR